MKIVKFKLEQLVEKVIELDDDRYNEIIEEYGTIGCYLSAYTNYGGVISYEISERNSEIKTLSEERTKYELNITGVMCACTNQQLEELNKLVNDFGLKNDLAKNALEAMVFSECYYNKIKKIMNDD